MLKLPFRDELTLTRRELVWISPWIIEWFMWIVAFVFIFTPRGRRRRSSLTGMPNKWTMIDEYNLVVSSDGRWLERSLWMLLLCHVRYLILYKLKMHFLLRFMFLNVFVEPVTAQILSSTLSLQSAMRNVPIIIHHYRFSLLLLKTLWEIFQWQIFAVLTLLIGAAEVRKYRVRKHQMPVAVTPLVQRILSLSGRIRRYQFLSYVPDPSIAILKVSLWVH